MLVLFLLWRGYKSSLLVLSMKKFGFSLIELIIVIAILGILAGMMSGNFFSSLRKSRDAKRKTDLENVKHALELYYNDYKKYPVAVDNKISVDGSSGIDWGNKFEDEKGTLYMQKLPEDPKASSDYKYYYAADTEGTYSKLYACLENDQDFQRKRDGYSDASCDWCTIDGDYCNYGISSPNTSP